ncbi:MAG TPA: hypothetical protein VKA70_06080 [Blastocatellia bacterium]|nr:hypothetical protein [Blastocatellia bacterium]
MYVRTRDQLGRLPPSYFYGSHINGLGEKTPKPILLTHYHVRKALHPGAGLLSDTNADVMTVARMKPGYVEVTDSRRANLQKEVDKLIQTKYSSAVSPNVNLRIALVDLTEVKHHTPIFGGFWSFNPGSEMEGASLPKILALYAAYQLRFDLDTFAALKGITKASALQLSIANEWKKAGLTTQPKLAGLFTFVEKSGSTVEAKLRRKPAIHSNSDARALILALGFEYIGSVALQSGLFDEKQGGLWLNAAYAKPAITWSGSPFPKLPRHCITALSAATYFTLLAQGRLVNQASSNEIASVLRLKCMEPGLLDGVNSLPGVIGASPNKCGILSPYYHEAIHVNRQPPGGRRLEYVAAVISKEPPALDFVTLGKELDSIIAKLNP